MKTGVYTITNLVNGKIYVGSTKQSFKERWACHLCLLKGNKHINTHLQSSWNKYGESNFKFEILEKYPIELCLSMEQYWINMLNVCNRKFGYNQNVLSTGRFGSKLSEESKRKIRKARSKQENCGQIVILKFNLCGVFLKRYSSLKIASIENNNIGTSNISKCAKGIYKTCGGFIWKYENILKIRKNRANQLLINKKEVTKRYNKNR